MLRQGLQLGYAMVSLLFIFNTIVSPPSYKFESY